MRQSQTKESIATTLDYLDKSSEHETSKCSVEGHEHHSSSEVSSKCDQDITTCTDVDQDIHVERHPKIDSVGWKSADSGCLSAENSMGSPDTREHPCDLHNIQPNSTANINICDSVGSETCMSLNCTMHMKHLGQPLEECHQSDSSPCNTDTSGQTSLSSLPPDDSAGHLSNVEVVLGGMVLKKLENGYYVHERSFNFVR